MSQNTNYSNDFGFLGEMTAEEAAKVDKKGGGKYPAMCLIQFSEAVVHKSDNGVVSLNLRFKQIDEETKSLGDKEYWLDTKFLVGKNNEINSRHKREQQFVNNLRNLLGVTPGSPWNVEDRPANVWDKEVKQQVSKPVPQLIDILGKPFYALVTLSQRHKQIMVNGYSGREITPFNIDPQAHEEERISPETVYFYDYSADPVSVWDIWGTYDMKTKQTQAEKLDGKEPEAYIKDLEYAQSKADEGFFNAKSYSLAEQQELRKKKLMDKLKNEFNMARWIQFNPSAGTTASDMPSF